MALALACSRSLALRQKPAACLPLEAGLPARQHSSPAAGAARLVTSSTSSSKSGAGNSQGLGSLGAPSAAVPLHHRQQQQQQQQQQARCLTTAGPSGSKSPSLGSDQQGSSEHKPLVQHMLELLVQYEQADGLPAAAVQDLPNQQQQKVQELLHSVSLLCNQDRYFWLNRQLQGLKVRTVLGKQGGTVHRYSIAFLDPRSTADIMVPDPCGTCQPISCFDYITRKFPGVQDELVCGAAGQPLLPCIGVQLSAGRAAAAGGSADSLERRFITYPVEACWLEQGKVKKGFGGWPPTEAVCSAHAADPSHTSQVPPWIQDVLKSRQWALQSSEDGETVCHQDARAKATQLPELLPAAATAAAAPLSAARPSLAAAAAAAAAGQGNALDAAHALDMQEGFKVFIRSLLPTKEEKAVMRSTLEAVSRACEQIRLESPDTGLRWNVASVIKAGSFEKATGLRRNGDLDVVLKLRCHGSSCFDSCRRELLAAVEQQLGRAAGADAAASPDAGWQVKACHTEHFLRLEHPQLQLQLDVQVARYYGHTEAEQRQQLLQPLLAAAEAAAAGQHASLRRSVSASASGSDAGCEHTMDGSSSSSSSYSASLPRLLHIEAVRPRVTDLSESQAAVISGIEQRYKQRGLVGYGRLVTDVIRAVKAWSKFGLPAALQAGGAAAEECKGPPCYLWEVFVLYVLEQRSGQGRVYDQARPLELFMDVMQAAQRLRCTPAPSTNQQGLSTQQQQQQQPQQQQCNEEPIILEVYYSREQALLPSFSALWGAGRLYRPAIIHPVDPSYNCTAWQPFRQWDQLAAAAGTLHQQLQEAMQGRAGGGANGSAAAAAAAGDSAWQRLCSDSSCTLGAAVKAFVQ